MPLDGPERQGWRAGLAHGSDNASVPPCSHIAPRASIGLLDLTRREELFILNDHNAHTVPTIGIGPDTRQDIVDRINDIAVAVVADRPVSALRGIARAGHGRVDEQVEPVAGPLHERTPLQPDGSGVLPPGQRLLP